MQVGFNSKEHDPTLSYFLPLRIRLPLFISAGFVLCHIFSVYLPTVEINVEVIEDNRVEEEEVTIFKIISIVKVWCRKTKKNIVLIAVKRRTVKLILQLLLRL